MNVNIFEVKLDSNRRLFAADDVNDWKEKWLDSWKIHVDISIFYSLNDSFDSSGKTLIVSKFTARVIFCCEHIIESQSFIF